jgi:integrase
MTIYKPRNSRFWHYDFQFRGQRFHGSTGCQAKRDAERYERGRRTEVALGTKVKPSITIDDACSLYWDHKGQFERGNTLKGQLLRLAQRLGPGKMIVDVTAVDLNAYIAKRRAETARNSDRLVSAATVNREMQVLRRIVRHLEDAYSVPVIGWTKLFLREPQERIRELSAEEETRLFGHLDTDLAAVAEFALLSGQRRGAVITLLWSKVDLRKGWAEVLTKGNVWHKFPLTPRMVAIIANRPKVAAQVFTYECERPSPPRGDRPLRQKGERYPFSEEGWKRRWSRALTAAGIEDFRFHDLRHTAGSRITRGSNIKVAQKMLGHTRIETTSRYAHVHEEDIRNALIAAEPRNSPVAGSVVALNPLKEKRK